MIVQNNFRREVTMESGREFPPSFQDGFGFGMLNPPQCGGLISGCPCRDELARTRWFEMRNQCGQADADVI
jgi:hypothetical protein